ncbi:MAG: efflux RND transporter periplasmic adaptor subunit [Rhodocyclaceae bacterium]|jgi:RND family efflux transporter MFP subunit|nr:efflux RND transporter periplasmic adaptor subunit [Rhodocyclaceae bacterium]
MTSRHAILLLAAVLPGLTLAQAAPLATATVELREIELTYPAEAVIEAVRQATIAAQVPGRVVEVRADAGDAVKQGQLLMRIDAREAAEGYAASQATLANAKANYERTKNLHTQKFISKAALDKAESDYKAAQAGSGAAGAAASHASIVSPLTGFVAQRHTEAGEMATPGRPLVTVYDPKGLRVTSSIPQYKLAEVRAHLRAKVEFPENGKWVDASKVEVLPAADPRTHTVTARVYLPDNQPGILPGMFARAHFVTGKAKKLLVPAAAVLRRGEVTAVYVIDEKSGARLRQVRLSEPFTVGGQTPGGFHEVLAGLSAGEKVALDPVKAGITARR